MYLPMGAMAIGMIAVVAGGHASAILYVGSGAMAVGMVGMMAGQMMRGRGDRKLKLNGLRRDYLLYVYCHTDYLFCDRQDHRYACIR